MERQYRYRAACLVTAGLVIAGRGPRDPKGPPAVAIVGVTLIDGRGGPPLPGATVVVAGDRIVAAGTAGDVVIPAGATVDSAAGRFLIPGLIDTHAHAMVPVCGPMEGPYPGFSWDLSVGTMAALLRFGITTARSPATPTAAGIAIRDSIAAGAIPGPHLLVSGELIAANAFRTPDAVRQEIRTQAAAGVDYVKLYSSLGPDLVAAGVDEAHRAGLAAIGHLQATTWAEGIAAGIDQLTHAAPWTADLLAPDAQLAFREALRLRRGMRARIDWLELLDPAGAKVDSLVASLAQARIPLDPTLVAFDTKFSRDPITGRTGAARYRANPNVDAVPGLAALWDRCGTPTDDWTADDFRRAAQVWPRLLALVHRYHDGGVLLTAGSDTPNPWVIPGESLHRELELLVAAGIPPGEVLRIATRNGAEALGLGADRGTVEAGKRADLVLLDADPLAEIGNTRRIVWVMRDGRRTGLTGR